MIQEKCIRLHVLWLYRYVLASSVKIFKGLSREFLARFSYLATGFTDAFSQLFQVAIGSHLLTFTSGGPCQLSSLKQ